MWKWKEIQKLLWESKRGKIIEKIKISDVDKVSGIFFYENDRYVFNFI